MMVFGLAASRDTVEGMKDKLVKDLRGVVADGDDLLKLMANSSAEEFTVARGKIEGKLDEARARLDHARIAVTEKAKGAAHATHEYALDNPWKILGAAAAAGFVMALLLRRH